MSSQLHRNGPALGLPPLETRSFRPAGDIGNLCHGLCHNPAIRARIVQSSTVSLRHTRQAENMR